MSKQQTVTYTALDLKIFKENVTDETYVDLLKAYKLITVKFLWFVTITYIYGISNQLMKISH